MIRLTERQLRTLKTPYKKGSKDYRTKQRIFRGIAKKIRSDRNGAIDWLDENYPGWRGCRVEYTIAPQEKRRHLAG